MHLIPAPNANNSHEPGRSSWERWRFAGEFRFSAPDWPAGRQRSQEVHSELNHDAKGLARAADVIVEPWRFKTRLHLLMSENHRAAAMRFVLSKRLSLKNLS
jgi:hypothetical protein